MTAAEIIAKADVQLDAFIKSLEPVQDAWVVKGRYFQGCPTLGSIPENGVDAAVDAAKMAEVIQTKNISWADSKLVIPDMCVRVTVNEYRMPGGVLGWFIVADFKDDKGKRWRKVIDKGPGRFGSDWCIIDDLDKVVEDE